MRLYTKEDDIYINIPSNMINNIDEDNILLKEYIIIYKNVEKLKEYIIKYLFEKDSSITQKNIGDLLLNIKSEENLDIDYTGEELTIAFNYKFVLEALKNIDSDEVKVGLNTPLSATMFRPNNEEDYVCLIMPVQIR